MRKYWAIRMILCTISCASKPADPGDKPNAAMENSGECRQTTCERILWPNVAVMVSSARDGGARLEYLVAVPPEPIEGKSFIPDSFFSPLLLDDGTMVRFDYAFATNPSVQRITLKAKDELGSVATLAIDLAAFNTCGLSMALTTLVIGETGLSFTHPTFISPCRGLN